MTLYKAVFLGDENTPYTEITGTSIQEVMDKARNGQNPTGAKINPDNLYGEGFSHSVADIPTGNDNATTFLGTEEATSIGGQQQSPQGQGKYFAWAQTPDGRVLSMQGEQQAVLDDIKNSGWQLLQGQAQTAKYNKNTS